jgi:hypothetical protein
VLPIRSSFRVPSDIGERPGKVLDDDRNQVAEQIAERCFLPALPVAGHLESPEVYGVSTEPEVFERLLVRSRFYGQGVAMSANAQMLQAVPAEYFL